MNRNYAATSNCRVKPLLAWKAEYALTYPDLHAEHQALLQIAAELETAVDNRQSQDQILGLFERLVAYARFHAQNEERVLRSCGFPDVATFCQEHRTLDARAMVCESEIRQGIVGSYGKTLALLEDLVVKHIREADQKLGIHLTSHRAPGPLLAES